MTFRTATVHLVVGVLLVCPYSCLCRAVDSLRSSPAEGSRGGCTCCNHSLPKKDRQRPGEPIRCPASGTCLCRGAIMDRPATVPDFDHSVVSSLRPDATFLIGDSLVLNDAFSRNRAASHFSWVDSGRALRALIESFLL